MNYKPALTGMQKPNPVLFLCFETLTFDLLTLNKWVSGTHGGTFLYQV